MKNSDTGSLPKFVNTRQNPAAPTQEAMPKASTIPDITKSGHSAKVSQGEKEEKTAMSHDRHPGQAKREPGPIAILGKLKATMDPGYRLRNSGMTVVSVLYFI